MEKMFLIGWKENGTYKCKVIYGLTEAREFAKKVSVEWETAQITGSEICEHFRNGKFTW